MSDQQLTTELVLLIMGWKIAPGRYIKSGRSWTPMSQFKPLDRIADAFQLLERAGAEYQLTAKGRSTFTAEVEIGCSKGKASGPAKARVITIAVARAVGITVPAAVDGRKRNGI
jgi:hypothetical protein